jgi:hypothetical protein
MTAEQAIVCTEQGYRRARLIMRLGDWAITHRCRGHAELHGVTHLPTGALIATLSKPDMLATDALMDLLQTLDERVPSFDAQSIDIARPIITAALNECGVSP